MSQAGQDSDRQLCHSCRGHDRRFLPCLRCAVGLAAFDGGWLLFVLVLTVSSAVLA